MAQDNLPYIRDVRIFDLNFTMPNAAGLAFSAQANAFLLLADHSTAQAAAGPANLLLISPFEDLVGSANLPPIASPINMAYDSQANQLLLLDTATNQFIEIKAGPTGPDPASITRFLAGPLGLQNPQGMTLDPASGRLFILDSATSHIVRVEPDAQHSFDPAAALAEGRISQVDLSQLGLGVLRGLAFNPTNGHLYFLNPAELKLYEVTETGQLVATRDLSDLDLLFRDPQGIVFAPSGDVTDDAAQMNLFLVDSGLETSAAGPYHLYLPLIIKQGQAAAPGAPTEGNAAGQGSGRIIEFTLTPPSIGPMAVTSLDVRVSASSDDAEQAASGSVNLTSTDLELVLDSSVQTVGMRFNGISIPPGATISNAYVQFQVDAISTITPTILTIQGQAADNAATFAAVANNISSRPRTSAAVSWSVPLWPTRDVAGPDQRTPNLATVVQEIVTRPGWTSGNSLVIIITGSGKRLAEAFNGVPAAAPLLHVEYDTGSANNPPVVSAGPDQTITLPSTAALDGTVSDDSLPTPPTLTTTWSQVSGPGTVTFGNANAVDTSASFSVAGSYTLRLTANDSALSTSDDIVITVNPSAPSTILDVRVSASSDDAEQGASGSVDLISSDLELVLEGSTNQTVGMRFNGISIPHGSTISNAYVQFQVDEIFTGTTSLTIQGEDGDNAATFAATTNNISTRPRTSAAVPWSPPPWTTVGLAGLDQRTPNLAAVVQEIVARPGWSSGNSLVIIITGSGRRTAESFNTGPAVAPLLHVEYTASGNQPPGVTISAPADGSAFNEGASITFTGTANDFEDGDLTASLAWESDLDGPIGNGGSFSRSDLSVGAHTITATVTDTEGQTAVDTARITVLNTGTAVFVGAGDIASCTRVQDEQTAQLLDNIPGTVYLVGDNVYPNGTAAEYANCYDPTWGRHKARTRPALGNHEYDVEVGAAGYFTYFGAAASPLDTNCTSNCKGYYSFDLEAWHIIVLNSECGQVGGCTPTSPQGQWLQADLAAHPNTCSLAIFHRPLFSSSFVSTAMRNFWLPLYAAGADIVLSGHVHNYERFAPQNADGVAEPGRGIREFVVGTGGSGLSSFGTIAANSVVRNNTDHGVLKLTLHPTSYDWEFIPIAGKTFTDTGSALCVTP